MSDSYAKLFRSIAASTIVSEPLATRWLWVTMISQANKHGHVYASIPGLARIANITVQEVEAALTCFMSPDPYSRSSENEGRRIEEIDGGWLLLTHAKYAAVRSTEERAEYKRHWDRENRSGSRRKSDKSDTNPTGSDKSDKSDASDPTSTNTSSINKSTGQHAARFADFWSLYPNRKGKADALKAWQRKKLDTIADTIIADVQARIEGDGDWKRGYVPHGSTYVISERWQDDVRGDAPHVSNHEALMAGVL
jgi:hypothetical protein